MPVAVRAQIEKFTPSPVTLAPSGWVSPGRTPAVMRTSSCLLHDCAGHPSHMERPQTSDGQHRAIIQRLERPGYPFDIAEIILPVNAAGHPVERPLVGDEACR